MFKERIKTSVIVLLIVNLIALTCRLWFGNGLLRDEIADFARGLPLAERFFPDEKISIPREMLSRPRKILVNDGALWIACYNTDVAFTPIENRTRQIIEAFLRGDAADSKAVTFRDWQAALENMSIYVELPIAYTPEMLCSVMGVDGGRHPTEFSAIRDFVILPSTEETGVFILVRDAYDNDNAYIYQFPKDSFSLPAGDLAIYTENSSGYYEPAFSTGVEPEGVSLDPMVLFFDSRPSTAALIPSNPLEIPENSRSIVSAFFNNADTAGRYGEEGTRVYVENYGDAVIYPVGLFEYRAVDDSKGVKIAETYSSYYETVNSAISFAESLWGMVSDRPLSALVSSDLTQAADRIHITMDYYQGGRPVAVSLDGDFEHLSHGIEMDIVSGRIVSYRQLFRNYSYGETSALSGDFVGALDHFVNEFAVRADPVISDIYIGYMDQGGSESLRAGWLAKLRGDDDTYAYSGEEPEAADAAPVDGEPESEVTAE